jgi:uncharacterized protein (UPF0332 family)
LWFFFAKGIILLKSSIDFLNSPSSLKFSAFVKSWEYSCFVSVFLEGKSLLLVNEKIKKKARGIVVIIFLEFINLSNPINFIEIYLHY